MSILICLRVFYKYNTSEFSDLHQKPVAKEPCPISLVDHYVVCNVLGRFSVSPGRGDPSVSGRPERWPMGHRARPVSGPGKSGHCPLWLKKMGAMPALQKRRIYVKLMDNHKSAEEIIALWYMFLTFVSHSPSPFPPCCLFPTMPDRFKTNYVVTCQIDNSIDID